MNSESERHRDERPKLAPRTKAIDYRIRSAQITSPLPRPSRECDERGERQNEHSLCDGYAPLKNKERQPSNDRAMERAQRLQSTKSPEIFSFPPLSGMCSKAQSMPEIRSNIDGVVDERDGRRFQEQIEISGEGHCRIATRDQSIYGLAVRGHQFGCHQCKEVH